MIPETVTSISECAFAFAYYLNEIEFNDKITAIPYHAFYNTLKLYVIDLPDTVKTVNPSAFENCVSVSKIILGSGIEQESLNEIRFYQCSKLREIYNLTGHDFEREGIATI